MKARSTASKSTAAKSKASRLLTISKKANRLGSLIVSTSSAPKAQASSSSGLIRKSGDDKAAQTLEIVLKRLKVSKVRCVDVETSGLDWKKNHIVGYVVSFSGDPRDSYYVPFRHLGNANVGRREGPKGEHGWDNGLGPGESELIKELDRPGTTTFGHNLAFDLKFIRRAGVLFNFRARCEDTMINACLIDELQGRFNLEACANVMGVQAKKSAQIIDYLCSKFPEAAKAPKQAMSQYWRLAGDDPMAVEYAVGDGTTTWQLRDKQMLEIEKQELMRVWDIESRLIPVLARMSTRGIKIDEQRLSKLATFIKQQVGDGSDAFPGELMKDFPKDFNVRSSTDVKWWMEQAGQTDWPRTAPSKTFPQGQPSFKEDWLKKSEAGQKIVKVRKLETLGSTFVNPLRTTHMWHGRVHTNYNQLRTDEYGTITGRLSCDSPNLQATPMHDAEISNQYLSTFVADDGMTWGHADMSQIEPRLLTYYSRCKVLMAGYKSDPPIDAHTAVAQAANKDWGKMNDAERKYYRNAVAKRINQLVITGGGKKTMAEKYGMSEEDADRFWSEYHRAMPEVKAIQRKMEIRFKQRGYILTLLGRKCRLQDPNRSYVALNRALQGSNADLIKLKMVECDDYLASVGRPVDILNTVHDAIDFQFPEEGRVHYEKCLEIMNDCGPGAAIELDVPTVVDHGEGPSWAAAAHK